VNRDTLIAYLVHQLPEDERAQVAEQLTADPAVHEELRLAEAELLDQYVRGDLADGQRALVEQFLLTSETQQRKLAFAAALHTAMAGKRRTSWSWVALAAAAAFIAVAGGAVWLTVQNARLRRDLAATRTAAAAPSGAVYAVFIPINAVRGQPQTTRIRIPAGMEVIRLDLEIDSGDERQTLSASVTQAGRMVWRQTPVTAAARGTISIASLWLPVQLLGTGAVEAALEARGQPIASYSFIIER